MNKSLLISLTAGICLLPHTAHALSVRQISTEQLEGVRGQIISLKLSPGYGLVINFLTVGETIVKAWLDDPSRIALSFDGELCQHHQGNCTNTGANVVHLRQIQPIDLPYITHSPTGETLLTLIVEGAHLQRKVYQFKIIPTDSEPEYTAITVVPETKYSPLIIAKNNSRHEPKSHLQTAPPPEPNSQLNRARAERPHNDIDPQIDSLSLANDLVYGLLVATQKGEIPYHSNTYLKVQNLIRLLRRGQDLPESTNQALVPMQLARQLLDWGQARPSPYYIAQ